MPKSKRNKQVELAKTKKRGLEWKKKLFQEIRTSVDSYTNAFVFCVNDMRNSKMKTVREQWRHSRFFIGKNKIMAMALGRFAEEEYKPNLHKIGKQIKGQRGLLFSNKSTEEVLSWFRSYTEGDFARSGNIATEDVKLMAGPLSQFPHNLEPYLRQLGLPTTLVKGVIHLLKDHEVCKEGDSLTPETAKILKLLGYEMAEFHVTINCMWSQDGSFVQFTEDVDTDTKENLKKNKKKKSNSFKVEEASNPPDIEEMEIGEEEDDDDDLSETEDKEISSIISKITDEKDESAKEDVDDISSDLSEAEDNETSYSIPKVTGEKDESTKKDVDDASPDLSEKEDKDTSYSIPKVTNEKDDADDDNESPDLTEAEDKETSYSISKITIEKDESNTSPAKVTSISSYTSTPKEKSNDLEENEKVIEENSIPISQKEENPEVVKDAPKNAKKKKMTKPSNNVNEEEEELDARQSRSRKRKVKAKKAPAKNISLPMTPDANTSQDSPLFRELRNRSVKVIRKRNK